MGQYLSYRNPIPTDQPQNTNSMPTNSSEVSILTFNILADIYAPYQTHVSKKHLKFSYRKPLISSILNSSHCDFICLQEVDTYDSYFKQYLESLGYTSQYKTRPTDYNPDGSLIAWKSDRWSVIETVIIDYNDHYKVKQNSAYRKNNVGLLICFQENSSNKRIIIGTSHFFWNPQYEYVKFLQGKVFASSALDLKLKYNCDVILTGDLNSEPWSYTIKYLTGQDLELQAGDEVSNEILTMVEENRLQLKSAFAEYSQGTHPEFTNYTKDYKGCIDYILHSPELQVTQLGFVPSRQDFRDVVAIPNHEHPSDHLPLSAKFLF